MIDRLLLTYCCRECNGSVDYMPGALGATTEQEGNLNDCERALCDIMVWIENNFDMELSGIVRVVLQTRGSACTYHDYRFTPPILGHSAFVTIIRFDFLGLYFPYADPVATAG